MPGIGRRGRRFRCGLRSRLFLTRPAPCSKFFTPPRVAKRHAVKCRRFLIKMTDVQIEVLVAVERQNSFCLSWRNPIPARLASTFVQESLKALILVVPFPASHRAIADS